MPFGVTSNLWMLLKHPANEYVPKDAFIEMRERYALQFFSKVDPGFAKHSTKVDLIHVGQATLFHNQFPQTELQISAELRSHASVRIRLCIS